MDTNLKARLRTLAESPERILEILRILFMPTVGITILIYPAAMFGAIMASDSGTATAMRVSLLALFGFTFYLGAVLIIAAKWSNWPLISSILLAIVTLANTTALIFIPEITIHLPLVLTGFLSISIQAPYQAILGGTLFVVFFIMVPMLAIWRLIRHAFDMDFVPSDRTVELWDLKNLD